MKKLLSFITVCIMMVSGINAFAADVAEMPITICCSGDIYSIDFVYETNADISGVSLKVDGCMYDWNYIKSEARLYIGIASGNPIPKTDVLAVVSSEGNAELKLVSAVVNGSITDGVREKHTITAVPDIAPGFDTPGYTGRKICSDCGFVSSEGQTQNPTGPVVSAVLSADKTLTVSGGLSDDKDAEGVTYIAVYDENRRLLNVHDATKDDQSGFKTVFKDCADAAEVKIFRWRAAVMEPIYDAVKVTVSNS